VLPMAEVIPAVEQGFLAISKGGAIVPERLRMDVPSSAGVMFGMPACLSIRDPSDSGGVGHCLLGTKLVTVFPKNLALSMATVQASYLLLDGETGIPAALMEGRYLTAIRTAATSALATKLMAGPGPHTLAVLGAGVQGAFHIDAMREVCELTQVLVASRSQDKAEALAADTRKRLGIEAAVVDVTEAVSSSNLICTCTTSATPLFDGRTIRPGTHINAV